MARTHHITRKKAASKKKSFKVISKHFSKVDGMDKLRLQLTSAGARIVKTLRQGFMVEMTGEQRDHLNTSSMGIHITELHVQGDSSSDLTTSSSS
ncbi:unnamed protein product [Peniophora sp. CBMAI 1063]|nr:unnamed protein product [Peniophora sp. CBMAI 1063]